MKRNVFFHQQKKGRVFFLRNTTCTQKNLLFFLSLEVVDKDIGSYFKKDSKTLNIGVFWINEVRRGCHCELSNPKKKKKSSCRKIIALNYSPLFSFDKIELRNCRVSPVISTFLLNLFIFFIYYYSIVCLRFPPSCNYKPCKWQHFLNFVSIRFSMNRKYY